MFNFVFSLCILDFKPAFIFMRNWSDNFIHLINMGFLTLYICMLAVRIGFVYLLSGLGGSILSALFIHNSISVGASGALFGLLGAMLSELLTNWTIYSNKVSGYVLIVTL